VALGEAARLEVLPECRSTREGVDEYVRLLDEAGGKLAWSVVENEKGVENKVAFGPDRTVIPGFYLYRKL
jgi:hypothetical protein